MATITRGGVTLTPRLIFPASLTRPGQSVVHPVIGGGVDVTVRAPGPRAGQVRALWATEAAALAALEALAVPGGVWTFTAPGWSMTAYVVGDLGQDALTDWGGTWQLTISVQEPGS